MPYKNSPTNAGRKNSRVLLWAFCLKLLFTHSVPLFAEDETDEEIYVLSPFEIETSSSVGYLSQYDNSTSRLNLHYLEVPQTIDVITSQLLEDAAVFDSREFTSFVPNMTPRANTHQPEVFFIRGLQISNTYVDGYQTALGVNRDAALYDRVAYVKGPASAAMGRGEAGGLVNYVSKRPLGRQIGKWRLTGGTDDFYRAELDYGGVIGDSGNLSFRIPMYYEEGDEVRGSEINQKQKYGIGPSLLWRIGPETDLSLNTAFFKFVGPGSVGSAYWSHPDIHRSLEERGVLGPTEWNPFEYPLVPKDVMHGYPGKGRDSDVMESLLLFTHRFNDTISIRQGVRWQSIEDVRNQFSTPPQVIANPDRPGDFLVPVQQVYRLSDEKLWRAQGDILFEGLLGPVRNQLVFGYDAFRRDANQVQARARGNRARPLLQSLYFPDYTLPEDFDSATFGSLQRDRSDWQEGFGYFGQFNGSILDGRVAGMFGWRRDETKSQRTNNRNGMVDPIIRDSTAVPRYSISYRPTDWLSIFYLHSQQEDPTVTTAVWQNLTVVGDGELPPEGDPIYDETFTWQLNATLKEIGVKGSFFDGKFTATLGLFDILRQGFRVREQVFVPTNEAATGGYNAARNFVADGESVQGFEATISGQPTERLTLLASLGVMDGERPDDEGTIWGIESLIDTLKFRGKYSFLNEEKNGWEATWGINYYFKGWVIWQNSFTQFSDDQLGMDAGLSYYWDGGRYGAHLHAKNLGDELIYLSPNSQWSLRRILLSVSSRF